MAGIGLYGVFYSKCVKNGGVTTGYDGEVKLMGKAVAADFEANTPEDNPLYANNGVAENDASSGSGGTLSVTLDRMSLETSSELYGTTVEEVSIQVGEETVSGTEIVYKGDEVSAPVGTAYIKLHQEDGERIHEVVFYREVMYTRPSDAAQTMGESIEWQTPEIEGIVSGMQGDGTEPWYRKSRWPSQTAAIAYIYHLFGTSIDATQAQAIADGLNDEGGEDEVNV